MSYDFSAHSKEYEETAGKSHKYFIELKCKQLLETVKRLKPEPRRILDLGCGTGEAEEILSSHFDEITGIDDSAGMIEEASAKNTPNCRFERANVLHLPFPDGHFDLVFSFCLFHHLGEVQWKPAMEEAVRVGKDDAILLTFEHNPRNPITRRIVSQSPIDEGVTLVTLDYMARLYRDANVRVMEKGYIVFFPRLLSFFRPLEQFMHGVPYGGQYYIAGLIRK